MGEEITAVARGVAGRGDGEASKQRLCRLSARNARLDNRISLQKATQSVMKGKEAWGSFIPALASERRAPRQRCSG